MPMPDHLQLRCTFCSTIGPGTGELVDAGFLTANVASSHSSTSAAVCAGVNAAVLLGSCVTTLPPV